ncbi:adenylate kinase [Ichthyobacterium seriolicida]|uniref:Adenylate kinase n=1 Tax=Ichthyobacterium seriolicida TaxID=242600 RepID=A0A169Q425_9FLAO|nr:adenylate kinase [Ichthyobacterium seriolicida]BAU88533.1 adenylate kinase [Ichthyobacterium seriolicida]BAV94943.1 adenylate kinase [Ichthyobacterium seriolicida]
MLNIILLGAPGSGKGTQSQEIINLYDLCHISTGNMFRENIKEQTELGVLAKSYLDRGELVPDDITISMLEKEVKSNLNSKGFIFDGFPRTKQQAISLDSFMSKNSMSINYAISLDVSDDILKERLLRRGKDSNRSDDNPDIIDSRIADYHKKNSILKEYYNSQKKYISISGIGSISDIFAEICCSIEGTK